MSDAFKPFIAAAADARPLTAAEAADAFALIMSGEASDAQIGGFLMALRLRGETVDEIAAAAQAMRDRMTRITAPEGAVDVVGTGGDGKGTLNISTATCFVVAGAGRTVAKHGNRKLSSKSGAGDMLGAYGVNLDAAPETVARALRDIGVGFMIAPLYHPAMRHVGRARGELGVRTLFNILGPLTNPAGVKRQLTGAFSAHWLKPMAETLKSLGSEAAWLVHGADGADEISICGPTSVAALSEGIVSEFTVAPSDAGLPEHPFEAIVGGTPQENAKAFEDLLNGAPSAYRDAVLFNAAAALLIAGDVADLRAGAERAADSIDSGRARAAAEALREATRAG